MFRIKQHHISFRHAFEGVSWAFNSQPNFRVHLTLASIALALGLLFRVTYLEMTILILTITLCLGIEMVNTSIEAVTDLVIQKYDKQAKIAKDVAAGMMLLAAFGAVLVASFIFLPRIVGLFLGVL